MSDELEKFSAGKLDKGMKTFTPPFDQDFDLSTTTFNMSMGINQGLGPRYGMSPIPGHSDTETLGATQLPGLMKSEATLGTANTLLEDRRKIYAIVPITLGTYDDVLIKRPIYIFLIGQLDGSDLYFSFCVGGEIVSGSVVKHKSDIAKGLQAALHDLNGAAASSASNRGTIYKNFLSYPTASSSQSKFKLSSTSINYAMSAVLTVAGKKIPNFWFVGEKTTAGDATHSASLNCSETGSPAYGAGVVPMINGKQFVLNSREVEAFNIESTGPKMTYAYQMVVDLATSNIYTPTYNQDTSTVTVNFSATTATQIARLDAAAPAYSATSDVLVKDPESWANSAYTAVFAAIDKKSYCAIFQDWQRDINGMLPQLFDLTSPLMRPVDFRTLWYNGATSVRYTEDSIPKNTAFYFWPSFVDGVALPKSSASVFTTRDNQVTLGDADSGILRKNTVYEFTYSLYNKVLDYETNVGTPVKFTTDADDNVAISLYRDLKNGGGTFLQYPPVNSLNFPVTPTIGAGYPLSINFYEYRFYYRQLGSYEWLPALFIDAAQLYWYPNFQVLWACQAPIAALPGGQPGGFNDYSPLPVDSYIDVKVFQNRTFWMSEKTLVYSYRNNAFAYPLRNSSVIPKGTFKGMLEHAYAGQAEQSSRLMLFGSDAIYTGRFTGQPLTSPIVVSPDVIEQFPLDGSDFTVDFWTSYTSFSSRSAVVADGIVYYWGPKGIFRDNGVDLPERISQDIEPYLLTVYDPNKINEICCVYSDQTKEVIWIYDPKDATDGKSHGIVYNTRTGAFLHCHFDGKIDGVQTVDLSNSDVSRGTNGYRTLVFSRADGTQAIQRAYFFDYRNRSGDIYPTGEFMAKTVGALSSGQLTVTLASGFDATAFSGIAAGDKVCVQQGFDYSAQSLVQDMIATVVSKSSPNVTLSVPSSITSYYAGTLTQDRFFPLWFESKNAFDFILESDTWLPNGLIYNAFWERLHLLFNVNLLPEATPTTIDLAIRTPTSGDYASRVLSLIDNSRGNCQIFTALPNVNSTFYGQGIQLKFSGSHIGSEWVLQYLIAMASTQPGEAGDIRFLTQFEG